MGPATQKLPQKRRLIAMRTPDAKHLAVMMDVDVRMPRDMNGGGQKLIMLVL